ncbi:hypothetical protein [Rhizobium leguminosarum]|uniref:hypothetical protein n=1 Tax=Rhizobium leguminosarum TaxID=384 RepID=UPI003F9877CB
MAEILPFPSASLKNPAKPANVEANLPFSEAEQLNQMMQVRDRILRAFQKLETMRAELHLLSERG